MQTPQWTLDLFQGIDEMNMDKFMKPIADNAEFRFGNAPAAMGRDAIYQAVAGFFTTIKGLRHTLLNSWVADDSVVCRGIVTYTRHDDSQITLPFVNVYGMEGEKIRDYQIYMDINPLYAPQS